MIYFDTPLVWDKKYGLSCHLYSTIYGEEGHKELEEIARKLKLNPKWIQHEGSFKEHYDIMRGCIDRARKLGIKEVDSKHCVLHVYRKQLQYIKERIEEVKSLIKKEKKDN